MFMFRKLFCLSANVSFHGFRNLTTSSLIPIGPLSSSLKTLKVFKTGAPKIHSRFIGRQKDVKGLASLKSLLFDRYIDEKKSKHPIVILHGLLGFKEEWSLVGRQLNRNLGRKVYVIDMRDHGASPHTIYFSYEYMFCDLVSFMRNRNVKKATLIGHGLGGRVAMMLAMRYPFWVRSLVVVDDCPVGLTPGMVAMKKLLRDIKNLYLDRHYTLKEARKQAAAQLREKKYDEQIIDCIQKNMVENEWHTNWMWQFNLNLILENINEMLVYPISDDPTKTRTLFIGGTRSDFLPPEYEEDIKRRCFLKAQFKYIEGAGHWMHIEKPTEFIDIVTEFIDKDPSRQLEDVEEHPFGTPIEVAYQKYDENPREDCHKYPVIILHGLLGSKQNWNSLAKQLNRNLGRTVYTLDARNHGDSPHTELLTYELMMTDVIMFMHKHRIIKATIIGHSMGGRTAMMYAMSYPIMFEKLIVVDISPGGASPNLMGIKQLLNDIKSLNLDPKLTVREARAQASIQLKEKVKDEKVVSFILTNLVENTTRGPPGNQRVEGNWKWKFNLDCLIKNFEKQIANFEIVKLPCIVPTLFLGGADSDYLDPNDEAAIKTMFTKADFAYIQGAGHWVHAEKPNEFLDIVKKFMEKDHKSEGHN